MIDGTDARPTVEAALKAIVDATDGLRRVKRTTLAPNVAVDLARIYAGGLRLKTLLHTLLQDKAPIEELFARPGVRHEINTPLNHVVGYSELLLEEDGARSMAEALRAIHAAARTMFRVVNPAAATPAAEAPAGPGPTPVPDHGEARGIVLLVDDDPDHRELLRRHVAQMGHKTQQAEHGGRALELLGKERPDVILLDIHMPVMDGFQTLTAIKDHPALKEIPVVVLSALDDIQSVARCIELGAEDYLHKPANAVLLNARLAGALTRKRLRDQELQYLNAVADVSAAAVAIEMEMFEPSMLDNAASRQDAIGHLARVFQSMAREIQARQDRR
ncbi:MAG: response regulator [Candidatus Rokubacteria bacterium]|nr:response regulator [Candidatus Rokubacteria bacterium]